VGTADASSPAGEGGDAGHVVPLVLGIRHAVPDIVVIVRAVVVVAAVALGVADRPLGQAAPVGDARDGITAGVARGRGAALQAVGAKIGPQAAALVQTLGRLDMRVVGTAHGGASSTGSPRSRIALRGTQHRQAARSDGRGGQEAEGPTAGAACGQGARDLIETGRCRGARRRCAHGHRRTLGAPRQGRADRGAVAGRDPGRARNPGARVAAFPDRGEAQFCWPYFSDALYSPQAHRTRPKCHV
jgi:hypothetical protein